jgi:hypothetical protein
MLDYVFLQFQRLHGHRHYFFAKNRLYQQRDYWQWLVDGKPVPAPHIVKQMAVREHARRSGAKLFIETGTFLGEMVDAVHPLFSRVFSIELAERFCREAREFFRPVPHVVIVQGDSGKLLPGILADINEPVLFWLDGHYSGGDTGHGDESSPVIAELRTIIGHPVKNHVILIDDARCFTGNDGYPTMQEVFDLVKPESRGLRMEVADDIIRIFPKSGFDGMISKPE